MISDEFLKEIEDNYPEADGSLLLYYCGELLESLKEARKDQKFLQNLKEAGVNNWEGYHHGYDNGEN